MYTKGGIKLTPTPQSNLIFESNLTFDKAKNQFCLSPTKPEEIYIAGSTHVQFASLGNILSGDQLPSKIDIEIINPEVPQQTVHNFKLGQNLGTVQGNYFFYTPLALTHEAQIYYTNTLNGWSDKELDMMTVDHLDINAKVESNIPFGFKVIAYPIDKSRNKITKNGQPIEAILQSVGTNGESSDMLPALANTNIVIEIEGPLKDIDGIMLKAILSGAENNNSLKPNQNIQFTDIKLKVTREYINEFYTCSKKTDIYMKLSITIIALSIFLLSTFCAIAQSPQIGYFTDGYLYRHRMNPAIANEKNYASLALGNNNFSFRGNLALKDVFYQVDGKTATFMHTDLSSAEVLSKFKDKNQLGVNANLELLSAGFKAFKGYNIIGVSVRSNAHFTLLGELFRLAKEGIANKTYDISNFNTHTIAYIEVALGHFHHINEKFRIGAALKFLIGGANIDAQFNKAKLVLGEDQWTITSDAFIDANIKELTYKTSLNEDTNHRYVSGAEVIDGSGINEGGFAIDLGAVYQLNDNWSLSASIIDLGFINWNNNMLATTNGEKTFTSDEYIFNVDDDEPNNFDDELDLIGNGLSALYELDGNGDQGSVSKSIGTTFNIGASYILPQYQKLTIGLLSTTHIQENFDWTDLRASANWSPYNFLSASVSAAYGAFGGSLGWMFNFQPKGFNLYLTMDQITGTLSKQYLPLSGAGTFHMGLNIPF